MKKALQSAFVVVAIYLIILVSLLIGVSIDPSEGGLGWVMFLFVFGGTPIFLVLAVIAFFIGLVVGSNKDKKNPDTTTSK
jgi:RsiW-degrading membrane proteinase PrsW (M82 family)